MAERGTLARKVALIGQVIAQMAMPTMRISAHLITLVGQIMLVQKGILARRITLARKTGQTSPVVPTTLARRSSERAPITDWHARHLGLSRRSSGEAIACGGNIGTAGDEG
jgi:hypothetical protein